MEEKEKGDPKENEKEKAPTTNSLFFFFFGNMITTPFNDAKAKGHIKGHRRLENVPLKEN